MYVLLFGHRSHGGFIHQPRHQAFGGPVILHKQHYKPGGYKIRSNAARACPGDFVMFGLSLIIKIVHGNASTWQADRACSPLHTTDPIPHLQDVLPYAHSPVCGLLGLRTLALGGPTGLFAISLGTLLPNGSPRFSCGYSTSGRHSAYSVTDSQAGTPPEGNFQEDSCG